MKYKHLDHHANNSKIHFSTRTAFRKQGFQVDSYEPRVTANADSVCLKARAYGLVYFLQTVDPAANSHTYLRQLAVAVESSTTSSL